MPNTEIVKSDPDSQESTLSPAQLRARYRQALRDIKTSLSFGYKADMVKAAALADIRQHKLYELDGLKWNEFLDQIGIGERYGRRLVGLGEMLREGVKRYKGLKEAPQVLTQKDVFSAVESLVGDSSREISVRDLTKSAKTFESFASYLSGSGEEEPTQKLLESAALASKRAIPPPEENTFAQHHQDVAKQKGYIIDPNTKWYMNPDGTPLTNKQECEFITARDAMLVIERIERGLSEAKQALASATKTNKSFWIYRIHANDNKFHTDVTSKLLGIRRALDQLETLYSEFCAEPEGLR